MMLTTQFPSFKIRSFPVAEGVGPTLIPMSPSLTMGTGGGVICAI
jgi:hypothetical protein